MNGFNSPRRSFRMIGGRLLRLGALMALFSACIIVAQSHATPITLAFDAVVGPPRQGVDGFVPPSLGVSLQPGDTITGKFTFEPVDAPSNAFETTMVEAFPFVVNIKSASLMSSQFGIHVVNDVRSTEGPLDSIDFGCSFAGGGTICVPSSVSPFDATTWAVAMHFDGAASLLDGPDIPLNLATWQQLAPRTTLVMSMNDESRHMFYGFTGIVTAFQQAPEPSGSFIFMCGAILISLFRCRACKTNTDSTTGGNDVLSSPP